MSRREKGLELELRVTSWLSNSFGFDTKHDDLVRGYAVKRPHQVDVHGIKKKGMLIKFTYHLWAECKAHKVNRDHIRKLVANAQDVKEANERGIADWFPDVLMVCSDTGFDIDAIGWANKHKVYCVKVRNRSYRFIGNMTRKNLEQLKPSEY